MTPPLPQRVPLARLPTPIEHVPRWPRAGSGVELFVKRDDLTGAVLSGNKIRKLEFSLAEARAAGATALVTCGGVQSNHCRATALVAARLGMRCALLLRGAPEGPLDGNTLLGALAGAELHWVDADGYADRAARMAAIAGELAAAGHPAYVIPEGASNGVGALGYAQAAREIVTQCRKKGQSFDWVVHGCGSGGTTAGLLIGQALYGLPGRVRAFAVCDDTAFFAGHIGGILDEAAARFGVPRPPDEAIDVDDTAVGLGYGVNRPQELALIAQLAGQSGLLLDPTYGGKAFFGLCQSVDDGRIPAGARVLFIHTGGVFGLFARRVELTEVLRSG